MANVVTEQRLIDNNKRALIKYTFYSDGTAVANSVLVDVSTLALALNATGQIMTSNTNPKSHYRVTIKRIFGQVTSNDVKDPISLKLQWHFNGTNAPIVLCGTGAFDWDFQSMGDGAVITNPNVGSGSGDILYSTTLQTSGDFATLFLDLRKDSRDYDAGQTADPYAFNKVT